VGSVAPRPKAKGYWSLSYRSVVVSEVRCNADTFAEQLKQGLQGIVMGLFTRSLGWSPAAVEVFLVELRKQLNNKSYHLLDHASVLSLPTLS
jgi:hypothetical protein